MNKKTDENKNNFIEFMIKSDVLSFGEFRTKSGRLSPYFINTGNYKTGKQISELGQFYASLINNTLCDGFDAMYGPAYKGIPLVVSAADSLYREYNIDKPYFFNRKESKDHGEGGIFVGYKPMQNDKIIIIEDVVTAGTALRESMNILTDCSVTDMFISVNRSEKGLENITAIKEIENQFGIKVHSIIDVMDIYHYLKNVQNTPESRLMALKMEEYMDEYCIFD